MNNNKQVMQLMYDEAKIYLKEICPDNIDLDKYFNLKKTFFLSFFLYLLFEECTHFLYGHLQQSLLPCSLF